MPQIREQIAMVHLPPSKTLKYLFHVRKTEKSTCESKCFFVMHPFRKAFHIYIILSLQ